MTKAFLYDSLCGIVYRCMFAGIDSEGHAQWVNITPGEEPKTLEDYAREERWENIRFYLLSFEGEAARSVEVARVLGSVTELPVHELEVDLKRALRHMREIGVWWDMKPLQLSIRIVENDPKGRRRGKYTFIVEDDSNDYPLLANVDGFDSLEDVCRDIHTYLQVLEEEAGIECHVEMKKEGKGKSKN